MTVKMGTDTPIYTVHTDVLWRIFNINADLYWTERNIFAEKAARPLNVLRRTSQVCRKWRDIILSSPTLWSRVVELDLLSQKEEHWRNMVMERCGQSSLSISGRVNGGDAGSRNFFTGLLDNHWTRIRRFDVYIAEHSQIDDATWNNFLRPAKKLEILKLQNGRDSWYPFSALALSLRHSPDRPIFADDAPVLREFSLPVEYFSLRAPWSQHLHSLELVVTAFNATELLNGLGNMHSLEYLQVGESILEPQGLPTASVSLPRLRKLRINNTHRTSFFLLKYITPPKGSSLFLTTEDTNNIISPQDVADMSKELSRYVHNHFNRTGGFSKALTFKFGPSKLHFQARDTADEKLPMPSSELFRIDIFAQNLPPNGIATFLAGLDIRQYSRITRLEFVPYRADIVEDAQPVLTTLLASFPAVSVLVVSEYGFQALVKAEETLPDLLPALQTLWFKYVEPTSHNFADLLLAFLRQRAESGRPVTCINICESTIFEERLDWRYLEEFTGLRVLTQGGNLCAIEEYICGTGTPETLDMRKNGPPYMEE